MTRRERFLVWLSKKLPCRTIEGDNCPGKGPLLVRYYLLNTEWLGIYIHHLLRSDHERALHDHPWPCLILLVVGGYFEHHPAMDCSCHRERISWHYIPQWNLRYMPSKWQHRLEMTAPVWSLVLRFRKRRHWGFWTTEGFVPWDRYVYTDEDC